MLLLRMFLRSTNRRKDGKDHRYFSVVENRRLPGGKTAQRTVLYLGEINDQQQAAWRKTLAVFDEAEQRFTSMSLFPDDREVPADAIDSVQVRLSGLELKRPRVFGSCWLACELWQQLSLDEFWRHGCRQPGLPQRRIEGPLFPHSHPRSLPLRAYGPAPRRLISSPKQAADKRFVRKICG